MSKKTIALKGASKQKKQLRLNTAGNYWVKDVNISKGKDGKATILHHNLKKPVFTPLSELSKLLIDAAKKAA